MLLFQAIPLTQAMISLPQLHKLIEIDYFLFLWDFSKLAFDSSFVNETTAFQQ